ncbi:Glycosyltransferase [Lactococcus lactis subsp. lactis]|uniref:glycosyltransferase n=1 Tax=Lactococcus lactis TaxID=1358 RepID=UPI00071D08F4|nr:glycosyltransferase family 2 protein [Lactococcus lactis]KST91284.1 Glycosyltransferase [Lactococcus lactis subsp. lactis]
MLSAGAVILNYNSANDSIRLANILVNFKSIKKVIIVDNASTDNSRIQLNQVVNSKIKIILNNRNSGYNAGNNIGLKELVEKDNLEICFIINPDVSLSEETIIEVIENFEKHEDYAVLSSIHDGPGIAEEWQWFDKNDWSIKPSELLFITRFFNRKYKVRDKTLEDAMLLPDLSDVYGVIGAFLGIRSETLKEINYFDEDVFLYWEEIILAEQIQSLGKKIGLLNKVSFKHLHNYSNITLFKKIQTNLRLYSSALIVIKKYADLSITQRLFWNTSTRIKIFESKLLLSILKFFKIVGLRR